MAQTLGEAELLLSVDASRLNAGLNQAQQQARKAGDEIGEAFTKPGKKIETAANGLQYFIDAQGRARKANGQFVTAAERAAAGIKNIENNARRAGGGVDALGGKLLNLAGQFGLATSATGALIYSFQQVKAADDAKAAVRTLGVDSEKLTTSLSNLSIELDANISTLDLLKASYDVASSGFADAASATQILRASAAGARGGFADINDVARGTTAVLNAYGLTAADATRVVDGFVQAQADGVLTVRQYVDNIGEIVSVGAAAGISIEELNAAIATATLKGVQVNQAFTGFRQVISSILKPSKEATDLAKSLGIDYSLAGLKAKGFAGFLQDVAVKTGGAADKTAILLGSVEAQAALQPLLNDQLATYNKLLENQAKAAGVAAKAAETSTQTISGNIAKIQNKLSNLVISYKDNTNGALAETLGLVNSILTGLEKINRLLPKKPPPSGAVPGLAPGSNNSLGKNLLIGTREITQSLITNLINILSPDPTLSVRGIAGVNTARRQIVAALPTAQRMPRPSELPQTGTGAPRFAEASEANAALWERVKQEREAAAKTDAKLKAEIEKASKAAADNLREAAERVKQAAQSLRGAREGFASAVGQQFAIATNQQRQRAREILEQQVRAAERARAFDPSRVSARFGVPQTAGGLDLSQLTFRQLERLAQQTGTLANAEATLQGAVTENTKALQALAARRWEVQVNVRNNASGATTVDYQNVLR